MSQTYSTDREIKALKPADRWFDVKDEKARNLIVRVGPANSSGSFRRTFCLVTRFPGSKNPVRHAFGEYGDLTLEEARERAAEWRAQIRKNIDPRDAERKAREEVSRKRDRAFESVLARYIKARRRDGVRKVDEDERDFNRECLPAWKGRDVADIAMADILKVIEGIAERGAQRQALNMAQKIGTFFNWCADDDLIPASPYRPKRVTIAVGERQSRNRVLTDSEIAAFWTATETLGPVYSDVYRLLLLTGQRLNDIARASWSEIDFEKRTLTVPAARFKSDRDHVVPLADDALEILRNVRQWKGCQWVFTLNGRTPATIGDKVKGRLDKAMLEELRKATEEAEATIPAWVNHDLRRTVRTRLSELDVLDEVAEAVIGHMPAALVRVYNQSDRLRVKLEALTRWQGALRDIVGASVGSNVVPLVRA